MKRMQYCHACGKELGVYDKPHYDLDDCGEKECARETREAYRQRDDEARDAAEQDNYSRYGGNY